MRHRERRKIETILPCTRERNGSQIGIAYTPIEVIDEVMDDTVTPDFADKVRNGEIVNNPCEYTSTSLIGGQGSISAYVADYNFTDVWSGGCTTKYFLDDTGSTALVQNVELLSSVDDCKNKAMAKAISEIDATPYAFLEDAFEIRETIRFLRNPLGALRNLSKAFNRELRRKGRKADRTKAIAELWLQYRFAVSPLVRSTMDAIEALQSTLPKAQPRYTARGFGKEDMSSSDGSYDNVGKSTYFDVRDIDNVECKASILYEVKNPLRNTSFKLGLRVKDVPETIWAVMPYSFMVDRVINVSDVIRGATNLLDPSVNIISGSVTERRSLKRDIIAKPYWPGWAWTLNSDVYSKNIFSYKRTVWDPSFRDIIPPVELGGLIRDLTSTADLLSLIYVNFKGR